MENLLFAVIMGIIAIFFITTIGSWQLAVALGIASLFFLFYSEILSK
jgi:hypothetical protein